jgi:hypothetical protein
MTYFLIYAGLVGLLFAGKALSDDKPVSFILLALIIGWIALPIGISAGIFTILKGKSE